MSSFRIRFLFAAIAVLVVLAIHGYVVQGFWPLSYDSDLPSFVTPDVLTGIAVVSALVTLWIDFNFRPIIVTAWRVIAVVGFGLLFLHVLFKSSPPASEVLALTIFTAATVVAVLRIVNHLVFGYQQTREANDYAME